MKLWSIDLRCREGRYDEKREEYISRVGGNPEAKQRLESGKRTDPNGLVRKEKASPLTWEKRLLPGLRLRPPWRMIAIN